MRGYWDRGRLEPSRLGRREVYVLVCLRLVMRGVFNACFVFFFGFMRYSIGIPTLKEKAG